MDFFHLFHRQMIVFTYSKLEKLCINILTYFWCGIFTVYLISKSTFGQQPSFSYASCKTDVNLNLTLLTMSWSNLRMWFLLHFSYSFNFLVGKILRLLAHLLPKQLNVTCDQSAGKLGFKFSMVHTKSVLIRLFCLRSHSSARNTRHENYNCAVKKIIK